MDIFISIVTNPITYAFIFGLLTMFYTAWTLAHRQYLGVEKLFNLVSIALVTGWVSSLATQWVVTQQSFAAISLQSFWIHPTSIVVLAGYTGISLIASRYILKIRYPYWRTMDMLAISLAVFETIAIIGWSITQIELGSLAAVTASIVSLGIILLIYFKVERHGLATGIHLMTIFGVLILTRLLIPSWQESMTGVEWALDIGGILLGLTLSILRVSSRSEKVILQDIPRGVSQSFQETFTRAFKSKQQAKKQ